MEHDKKKNSSTCRGTCRSTGRYIVGEKKFADADVKAVRWFEPSSAGADFCHLRGGSDDDRSATSWVPSAKWIDNRRNGQKRSVGGDMKGGRRYIDDSLATGAKWEADRYRWLKLAVGHWRDLGNCAQNWQRWTGESWILDGPWW